MAKSPPGLKEGDVGPIDTVDAYRRIRPTLGVTPLTYARGLSDRYERDIFIKWESFHSTGSFKERGALNFLTTLQAKQPVCAASAGNHGLGVAYHAQRLGHPCTLVVPTTAPFVKIARAVAFGAEVVQVGLSYDEAREHATHLASERGMVFVPAYDHPQVIAGQASLGHEIFEQCPDVDSIVVPIGGGGLCAGVAIARAHVKSNCLMLGVRSEWVTKKLYESAGSPLLARRTLADGIAVKSLGTLTKPIIESSVSEMFEVQEGEIAEAMMQFLESEHAVVEGSGAVGLIPIIRGQLPKKAKRTVIVMSGSNVDLNVISRLINREMGHRSRMVKLLLSVPDRPGCLHTLLGVIAEDRANVIEVLHDRFFSEDPGNVEITIVVEVRDDSHKETLVQKLMSLGVGVEEVAMRRRFVRRGK